jgi:hypothetical protein
MTAPREWHTVPVGKGPAAAAAMIARLRAENGADRNLVFDTGGAALLAARVRELDERTVMLELADGRLRVVALNLIQRIAVG